MLNAKTVIHSSPSILDAFCALLQSKLVYKKGERDMVGKCQEE